MEWFKRDFFPEKLGLLLYVKILSKLNQIKEWGNEI